VRIGVVHHVVLVLIKRPPGAAVLFQKLIELDRGYWASQCTEAPATMLRKEVRAGGGTVISQVIVCAPQAAGLT